MDTFDLLGLLLLPALGWLWFCSLKAGEIALSATTAACNSENLLLLDDTVAILRIGLSLCNDGVLRIRRVYGFEYSDTGNERNERSIVLLGSRVLVINLNLQDTPERIALTKH
jgi:hypothetical protein